MIVDDFEFNEYVLKMSDSDLDKFAFDSGTTANYLKRHLIYKTKIPRPEMIEALVKASRGDFSKYQLVSWLYDLKRGDQ